MGRIKKTNLLFSILVGINKDEILGTRISKYMPDLFAIYHDTFLKNYFAPKEEGFVSPFLDQDNNLFIKNKGGYIVPVVIHVKLYETFETSGQVSFLGYFKTETTKTNSIYLLCSRDGTITDISATATTILDMSTNQIGRAKKAKIERFFPEILIDPAYRAASGKELTYKKDDNNVLTFVAQVSPIELRDPNNKEFFLAYQTISDGKRDINQNDRVYGYAIKLDLVEKDRYISTKIGLSHTDILKSIGDTSFKFKKKKKNAELVKGESTKSLEQDSTKQANDLIYGFDTEQVGLEINDLFQNNGIKFEIDAYLNDKTEAPKVLADLA